MKNAHEAQQRAELRFIQKAAVRERRGREEERDREADARDDADDDHVAPRDVARQVQARQLRDERRCARCRSACQQNRDQHEPRARAGSCRSTTPAFARPKKNSMTATGRLNVCSNSFSVSWASGASTNSPGSRAACGKNGTIGTSASAGCSPPR